MHPHRSTALTHMIGLHTRCCFEASAGQSPRQGAEHHARVRRRSLPPVIVEKSLASRHEKLLRGLRAGTITRFDAIADSDPGAGTL